MKRQNVLNKFKRQLMSSLKFTDNPSMDFDELPKKKWLQIPKAVRHRLESLNFHGYRKSKIDTKELFVPVNIRKK